MAKKPSKSDELAAAIHSASQPEKPATPAPAPATSGFTPPDNFAGFIKEVVTKIGHKSGKADVLAGITAQHGAEAAKWAEEKSGLSVAINNANKAAGFSGDDASPRKASAPSSSGEPTLADLMHAQDTLYTLGMGAEQLLKLVAELKSFGDLNTLEACLTAIIKIQTSGRAK
ncbi:hypothetical protein [Frigoriglobus tundricola]|uniref:Uncharacterized protein n=1 Tax=Frigoriglobus tundricola TaxID=2774151 RepID=A0A6M5YIV5_9BACT|nr:hypothetical protein [Frigoriglobus tundricola]QJW93261.1 hypothetical protein FTUN_0766 [Frigoriglobus tundricola]